MKKSIYSVKQERLQQWLKDRRLEKKLSMRDLGSILNRPHQFVGKVEQGERRLDVIEYLDYCEALGVSAVDGLKNIKS